MYYGLKPSERYLCHEDFIKTLLLLPNSENYDLSNTININGINPRGICKLHGEFEFYKRERGCAVCDKLRNPSNKRPLTVDQYKMYASTIYDNKYDYSLITELPYGRKDRRKISIICPKHGVFYIRHSAHISPKQRYSCNKCNRGSSKYEAIILKFLQDNNIDHESEKFFLDCFIQSEYRRNPLRFDFYLPKQNTIIEFDGPYHYTLVKFHKDWTDDKTKESLKHIQLRDKVKNQYVQNSDKKLIRIKYTQASNIIKILEQELLNIQHNIKLEIIDNILFYN